MSKDLTTILLRLDPEDKEPLKPEWIESVVRQRGRPVILRIAPLAAVGLTQVEACNIADGLPAEDPQLVSDLSARGSATFLHVNHEAKQAILQGFDKGTAIEGFIGEPGEEFDARVIARFGCNLEALHAADDGSRAGIGVVASRSAAVLPGRSLMLPIGMPTAMGSFAFHDRGLEREEQSERCAFFAFDKQLVPALTSTKGAELAKIVEQGKEPGHAEIVKALAALGDDNVTTAPPESRTILLRAMEMLILGSGRIFAAGDRAAFWDERVLPLLSMGTSEPVIDKDELESLDEAVSVLHALVEVVPSAAPPGGPGATLEGIGDAELRPLVPALVTDGTYAGSILALDATRITETLRKLDGEKLSGMVGRLQAAWWKTSSDKPAEGDEYAAFVKKVGERGQPDIDRVLRHLSELRVVVEVAAINDLAIAIAFYG